MAEITARRRGELVREVFEVLSQHPDGLPAKAVLEWVEGNTVASHNADTEDDTSCSGTRSSDSDNVGSEKASIL